MIRFLDVALGLIVWFAIAAVWCTVVTLIVLAAIGQ